MDEDRYYGVVIDPHLPRQDRGVPAFFDGWYDTRAAAEEAAGYFATRSPGANVCVVMQVGRQTTRAQQPDAWIGTPEDIAEGIDDRALQWPGAHHMIIGERGHLTQQGAQRMGTQWRKFAQRYPDGVFGFSIEGYGDDPRELWEIPEVVGYVQQWARHAGMDDLATATRLVGPNSPAGREIPEQRNLTLLAACGVFGEEMKATALRGGVR